MMTDPDAGGPNHTDPHPLHCFDHFETDRDPVLNLSVDLILLSGHYLEPAEICPYCIGTYSYRCSVSRSEARLFND
jgi:hypothetical protein